ncbi:MAG: hypothetical protein U1E69_21140 [Tabrizicola sp.]|uniref:hypothetical protein n=1 Tax=Tabrizicola sp. TaxID=2005166 RepID=UPI002AB82606|nr:hypothetical protein [Tabrizicola sp.]MDZ4089299.1 hypothetical protein [Tabrizicola sp.]
MGIDRIFKKGIKAVTNFGKDVIKTIAPAPLRIGMAVADKLSGNKGGGDPEATRQADEDRKFTEEMDAQTSQIKADTAQIEAENQKIFGMLGSMRSESDAMFQTAMGGAPGSDPLAGLPQDFEGKELFDRYSNPQAFGSPQSSVSASGLPPDIAQTLRQYGLDLDKLRMT